MSEKALIESLCRFGEVNQLDLSVGVRSHSSLYFLSFAYSDVKSGSFLTGVFGNGDTVEEAIADYAKKIEGEVLVIHAMTDKRKELQVPVWRELPREEEGILPRGLVIGKRLDQPVTVDCLSPEYRSALLRGRRMRWRPYPANNPEDAGCYAVKVQISQNRYGMRIDFWDEVRFVEYGEDVLNWMPLREPEVEDE